MSDAAMDNSEQVDYWNGKAGKRWTKEATALDGMLQPFAEAVLDQLPDDFSGNILDVGCGAGALSLLVAERFRNAKITGVDVSKPMLGLARERARAAGAAAEFIEADASAYTSAHSFDALVSRFGVMFFDQPAPAFANLRNQMQANARLSFACWRPAQENDWVMAPMQAALQFTQGPPPTPEPGAPGPFAFADAGHVTNILETSGWSDVQVQPWDGNISLPGDTIAASAEFMLGIGPLARVIAEQDIDRSAVLKVLQETFENQRGKSGRPELKAAAWIVTASA